MKTTIEIADSLLDQARVAAVADGTTLRALVEAGLRAELSARLQRTRYTLPDVSVGGEGVSPEFSVAGWAAIRDAIYGVAP